MAKESKKASVKNVDFSGVKDRGNFNPKQVAEGDYSAKIVKVEDGEAKQSGDFQYVFTIKLDKFSQHSYPYYCKLAENQLWKLRNLAIAAGLNVPKAKMKLDPNRLVGKSIGVTMADDEYEGKVKSVIDSVFPTSELENGTPAADDDDFDEDSAPEVAGDDDEPAEQPKKKKDKGSKADEKPAKKKKKGKKGDVEDINIDDV